MAFIGAALAKIGASALFAAKVAGPVTKGAALLAGAKVAGTAALATAATAATVAKASTQKSAAKTAKGQAEQAVRVRAAEFKTTEARLGKTTEKVSTIERAEALPDIAKKKASAIAAGKKKKRLTIATGPRGVLTEPEIAKPGLLGR